MKRSIELRKAREERGLTQERLEDISGVSQQTISAIETGARNVTISTLGVLADAMGCSLASLIREDDE